MLVFCFRWFHDSCPYIYIYIYIYIYNLLYLRSECIHEINFIHRIEMFAREQDQTRRNFVKDFEINSKTINKTLLKFSSWLCCFKIYITVRSEGKFLILQTMRPLKILFVSSLIHTCAAAAAAAFMILINFKSRFVIWGVSKINILPTGRVVTFLC